MKHSWPTLQDVQEARSIIKEFLPRTPLYAYPQLDKLLGARVFVKHENHLPTGAFKIRGGINLIAHLDAKQRRQGVVTASTGNHAQSIALAARLFDTPAVIVMPENANPSKVKAVESLGADLIFHGRIFDESREFAEKLAADRGMRFIHPANESHLIAGVATYALEIMEELPAPDMILVPVGGGSGACGCCLMMQAAHPEGSVIGVQAAQAPAAYQSWRRKRIVSDRMETRAEGLATNIGYELTQEILQKHLADFILVSEAEMEEAVILILEAIRNLVEEAGAAPLAAARKIKERIKGKRIVLVMTGGNISLPRLKSLLAR